VWGLTHSTKNAKTRALVTIGYMPTITFKPKSVTKELLSVLGDRARSVTVNRFGLGKDPGRRTLESIGGEYGITRERVRQIENFALKTIKNSPSFEEAQAVLDELRDFINALGGVLTERELLLQIADDQSTQNHIIFLLTLGDAFDKKKEDKHFNHRWSVDDDMSNRVHQALHGLYQGLSKDDLIAETEILKAFSKKLPGASAGKGDEDTLRRWLAISKVIGRNQLGEWGLTSSPNIKARGIRDYAYLVIRRHGSPLHFTEVADQIEKTFDRAAHVATCHNELIKDKARFALVGRGLYSLTEWGYSNGVVRDVISKVLGEEGPLSREELVEKILKERYVKENTVIVNLQNKKYFKRDQDGNYHLV